MKAAVISLGSKSSLMTIEAMKKYFDLVENIDIRNIEINLGEKKPIVLYQGKPLNKYDCIYAKGSFRYNQLLRALTSTLQANTYMPINASAFTIGHDKLLTQLKLEETKIPMPKTYLASTPESAKQILEKVNYPIIMKFPEGTQGKGVMFADSFASANSMLDALTALRQSFIIQEYIETGGTDLRVIVIGNKVAASMTRHAYEGEKRANIHAGSTGKPIIIEDHVRKLAIKTAKAIGAEICGVDILEGTKGPVVIEINLSPGLRGITEVTKIDVADKIARFLFEESKRYKETGGTSGVKKILDDVGIDNTKDNGANGQQIVTNIDFRSNRILLPEVATKISDLDENEEVTIEVSKGKIKITKL